MPGARLARLHQRIGGEAAPLAMLAAPLLAALSSSSLAGALIAAAALLVDRKAFNAAALARWRRVLAAPAALALWMAAASFWSPQPPAALVTLVRVLALCGFGAVAFLSVDGLSSLALRRAAFAGAGALFIVAIILLTEPLTGAAVFRVFSGFGDAASGVAFRADGAAQPIASLIDKTGGGATLLAPLLFPAALWARRRLGIAAAIGLLIAAGAGLIAHPALAGKLALALAVCGFAATYFCGPLAGRALVGALAGFVLLFPLAAPLALSKLEASSAYDRLEPSAQQRVAIYQYTAELAHQAPLVGHGFDASRPLSKAAPRIDIGVIEKASLLPTHPHNLSLQLWLELGIIGAALFAVFLWRLGALLIEAAAAARALAAARLAALCGLAAFAFVSYGAWRYEWIAAIFLVAFMARVFERDLQSD